MAKIEIFPLSTGHSCITLGVKNSLKITRSLTVFEILTLFHIPQNPRWPPKVAIIEIFPLCAGDSCTTTLWVKNLLEIALSLTVFKILTLFYFLQKSKMATKSGENRYFPLCKGHFCATLLVINSLEIALSLTVLQIFTLFHFPQKSKMAAKSGEN